MNFDHQVMKDYTMRFTKRQKGEPMTKQTISSYQSGLRKLCDLNILEYAFEPSKFVEELDKACKDQLYGSNLLMGLVKLLTVMSHEDMLKHWQPDELTYNKISEALTTYRTEVYNRRSQAKHRKIPEQDSST